MITEEHTRNNLNKPKRCSIGHKLFLIFLLVVFSGCSMAAKDHSFAQTQNPSLNSIFRQVNPAVVEIKVILDQAGQDNSDSEGVLGSGVVVSKDGHVLTSSHVVCRLCRYHRGSFPGQNNIQGFDCLLSSPG